MSKTAATIATLFTAIIIGTAAEGGTYLATGGGLNPIDGATVARFLYFAEFTDAGKQAYQNEDTTFDTVGKFLRNKMEGKDCHLVCAYISTTIPVFNKKVATQFYTYVAEGKNLPKYDDKYQVLYDYAAVRKYLDDIKLQEKKRKAEAEKPADLTFNL